MEKRRNRGIENGSAESKTRLLMMINYVFNAIVCKNRKQKDVWKYVKHDTKQVGERLWFISSQNF